MHTTRKTCHFYVTGICTTLEPSTTNYVLFRTISMCKYSYRRRGCPSSCPYCWDRRRKTKLAVNWYQVMSSWLWAHDGRGIVWRLREERRNLKHVERHIALTWEVMIWDDAPAAGHCQSSFLAELERRQLHWIIFRLNRIVRALTWLRCCKLCLSRWKL
jgi:hypothetical protein